jgi:hypothetical protein
MKMVSVTRRGSFSFPSENYCVPFRVKFPLRVEFILIIFKKFSRVPFGYVIHSVQCPSASILNLC